MDNPDTASHDYVVGYVTSSFAGDGSFRHYVDKNGHDAYNIRFVTKDDEINDAVYTRTKEIIPDVYRLNFMMSGNNGIKSSVRSNKKSAYEAIVRLEDENVGVNNSKGYFCGFLAGFCDSEGNVDNQKSIIRLSNTDMRYIDEVARCLDGLGIEYTIEKRPRDKQEHKECFVVRVKGKYAASRFLWYTRPVCKRKSLENYLEMQFQYYKQKVISKEVVTKKQYVYNLETTCHTYIANNFLVHNCHEDSRPDGKHGDILHLPFLDSIHPYTELAIGGGNPLAHPDLVPFLRLLKERKLIPNITVNKIHFMENIPLLQELTEQGLIYGLGISYLDWAEDTPEFIEAVKQFPNAVIHIINGMISMKGFWSLANCGLKILILGYKDFRRGKANMKQHRDDITDNESKLYDAVQKAVKDGSFRAISFDNLAINQLDVRRLMTEEQWTEFYMGDDGRDGAFTSASMYIDAVEGKFAKNSCCDIRYDVTANITEMFQYLRKQR